MPLQTTHRPSTLKEFYGNESLLESLESVLIREDDIPPAFLFTGASGCGKTTLGRIVAKRLECSGIDLKILNASNTRGIDTIRDIIQSASLAPVVGKRKVYIFEEVHQVTGAAAEAMLMLLEEPPKHAHFVLTTTEPEKLKVTIKRRCFVGDVKPLLRVTMLRLLKDISDKEGIDDYPKAILDKIIKAAEGSAGRALALLDMVIDVDDDKKAIELIEERSVSETSLADICRLLLKEGERWGQMKEVLKGVKGEPESIRRGILAWMEKVLLSRGDRRVAEVMTFFIDPVFNSGKPGLTLAIYFACMEE